MRPDAALAASLLRAAPRAYAQAVVDRLQALAPAAVQLPATFATPVADHEVRLLHLAEALSVDRPELLGASVRWYRIAFAHREVAPDYLDQSLRATAEVLDEELPPLARPLVARHLQLARAAAADGPVLLPSLLEEPAPLLQTARLFLLAVLEGRGDDAVALARGELDRGTPIADLHEHLLAKVQRELGRMWLMAEIPIADEHYGSQLVERVLSLLQERLPKPPPGAPRAFTMAVAGNLHAIGIRMVAQQLQLDGFEVQHLGVDMPAGDLPWLFADRQFELAALSVSLVLQLGTAVDTIALMRQRLGDRCPRILVGGEPFAIARDLHLQIGADAAATSAGDACRQARRLLGR